MVANLDDLCQRETVAGQIAAELFDGNVVARFGGIERLLNQDSCLVLFPAPPAMPDFAKDRDLLGEHNFNLAALQKRYTDFQAQSGPGNVN